MSSAVPGRSGPVLTVQAQPEGSVALAQLPGVQLVESW